MDESDMAPHHPAEHFAFGAPAPAAQATRVVEINMTSMRFNPGTVRVRQGETVRFVIGNTSGVEHEFVLADEATMQAHRKEMAAMRTSGASMEHDDPNAVMVMPRQKRELTWKFAGAGELAYACNFPGHYEAGMKGVISVR